MSRLVDPSDPTDPDFLASALRTAAVHYRTLHDVAMSGDPDDASRRMADHFAACSSTAEQAADQLEQGAVQLVTLPQGCTGTVTERHQGNLPLRRWYVEHDGPCPVHE